MRISNVNEKSENSSKKLMIQAGILLLLSLMLVLVIVLNLIKKPPVENISKAPVFISLPQRSNIENIYEVNGNIELEDMLTILPKVSGALVKLHVDVEDEVKKGQVVAELDREPYELQLRQAEAQYLAVKSTWNRIEKLYKSGGASQQQYEEVKAKFNASEAQYNLAKLQLSYTKIRSDMDGVVLKRHDHISVGMLVASEIPIFTIGQMDRLRIKVKMPEYKFPYLATSRENVAIRMYIPAFDQEVTAVIDSISPYVEAQSKSFEVNCKVDQEGISLPPGMSVKLAFVLDSRIGVPSVSRKALLGDDLIWLAVPRVQSDPDADSAVEGAVSSGDETVWVAEKLTYRPSFSNNEVIMLEEEHMDAVFITDGNAYLYPGMELIIKNPEVLDEAGRPQGVSEEESADQVSTGAEPVEADSASSDAAGEQPENGEGENA